MRTTSISMDLMPCHLLAVAEAPQRGEVPPAATVLPPTRLEARLRAVAGRRVPLEPLLVGLPSPSALWQLLLSYKT